MESEDQPFTGAHPTNREFVDQLQVWGFTRRKEDGVHLVYRGPRGGTLRVIRSLLGRADADRVAKAARLAGVTPEQFWAGPDHDTPEQHQPANSAAPTPRRAEAKRDSVTSLVLGVHAEADRPLSFDQVVDRTSGCITRAQVRTASAQLCREGDLDRIRTGVYQWSGGVRSLSRVVPPQTPREQPSPRPPLPMPAAAATATTHSSATRLFDQLFPSGVRMTAELLADFERWAELTEKLAEHANAS